MPSSNYKLKYRENWMNEKEMKEVDDRITLLIQNRAEMGEHYSRWEQEEIAYKGDQELIPNRPNSRVNIVNSLIEGQVSNIIDQNIAVVTKGESPSDKYYAEWARIGLDWALRKNKIQKIVEQHERRRLKFGVGIFKVYFDEYAISGFGLAKICCPPLNRIYIDRKIKDYMRFQEADYIAEAIRMSKTQFEEIYGEDKANAICYGKSYIEDTSIFDEENSTEDNNGATLIQWYERHKGKLRLLEFTGDGLLLYDSHKKGDRQTNQIKSEHKCESYYKNVDDKYPYFFTTLYPEEGELWGFGDAKLLNPIQNMINDLNCRGLTIVI